jgi:hypothetical protein
MGLDIRYPIGMMFTLIGLLLLGTGLFTSANAAFRLIPAININLIWGGVLFLFGALMWISAHRANKK